MKGILEFDLDDSYDRQAHLRASKSTSLVLALWDIDQYLRGEIKHAPDPLPTEVLNKLEDVRREILNIMSEHNINFDELIS